MVKRHVLFKEMSRVQVSRTKKIVRALRLNGSIRLELDYLEHDRLIIIIIIINDHNFHFFEMESVQFHDYNFPNNCVFILQIKKKDKPRLILGQRKK